ncbi:hypothetical protein MKEN_01333200 [Mycena kentingensis (nom. inval.)]|nr:hypothetical protein MKEN_01333200 [Mycena kentingensis (nom. inval.)]
MSVSLIPPELAASLSAALASLGNDAGIPARSNAPSTSPTLDLSPHLCMRPLHPHSSEYHGQDDHLQEIESIQTLPGIKWRSPISTSTKCSRSTTKPGTHKILVFFLVAPAVTLANASDGKSCRFDKIKEDLGTLTDEDIPGAIRFASFHLPRSRLQPKMSDSMAATETTPLIAAEPAARHSGGFNSYRRVLLATLLLSTTFWFTATPIVYVYRVFNCELYYQDPSHPPYTGTGDACAIPAIESATARDLSLMGVLVSFAGTMNLLLTTWQIRHWGLRSALVQQTFWPAVRNLTQIYATYVGGRLAITIMQTTQLITIAGGGLGYGLAVNSYITELVEAEGRTAAFGVLAAMMMLGTGIGYVAGGIAGERINISAPFQITFCLLVSSTIYTRVCLPYVPPTVAADVGNGGVVNIFASFSALRVFRPVNYVTATGRSKAYFGLTLLAFGTFAGSLATGYVLMMLQLTATNQYQYKTAENGYLMASLSVSRALFLTFAFPRIIKAGRRWYSSSDSHSRSASPQPSASEDTLVDIEAVIPSSAEGGDAPLPEEAAAPVAPPATDKIHGSRFDLVFLQWSMVVDALLTSLVAFSSRSWHINAAAVVLPLASGTAPACKGVLMDMIPSPPSTSSEPDQAAAAKRADALAGISIIETFSWITTVALFGQLFAFLSDLGRPNLVFFCNAGLALVAAAVLFGVRFPPLQVSAGPS